MEDVHEFGGIYMDSDAAFLRDISDLRHGGYANGVGGATARTMKHSGNISGVMMSVPNDAMMDIYIQAAHEFLDGSWAKAGVLLLTHLADHFPQCHMKC